MSRPRLVLVATLALCTAAVLSPTAAQAGSGTPVRVLLDHLSSPKGVSTVPNGVVVAQGAFGGPGPVLTYVLGGPQGGTTVPLTDPIRLGDVAAARGGTGWGLGAGSGEEGVPGDTWLYFRAADGTVTPVVDIAAYQAHDPDPTDQDQPPFPTESNPYGLAAAPNGDALVADAANNDLLRVTPAGVVTTMARFGTEAVKTDHLPAAQRPPVATIDAEAVPTSVAIGPDGYVYVGELKGFPFRPGSSRVWRIAPGAVGAQCTAGASHGGCTPYARGFTAIQDIAFDRERGTLYVYELARGGVLAFEAGLAPGGTFPSAVLLKVRPHDRTELAHGKLSQPGGVAVNKAGRVFVTDQVFTGGRLLRIGPWS